MSEVYDYRADGLASREDLSYLWSDTVEYLQETAPFHWGGGNGEFYGIEHDEEDIGHLPLVGWSSAPGFSDIVTRAEIKAETKQYPPVLERLPKGVRSIDFNCAEASIFYNPADGRQEAVGKSVTIEIHKKPLIAPAMQRVMRIILTRLDGGIVPIVSRPGVGVGHQLRHGECEALSIVAVSMHCARRRDSLSGRSLPRLPNS